MIKKSALILAVLAVFLAPTVGLTCEGKEHSEPCPYQTEEAAKLAVKAEGGCAESLKALIAHAKKEGCEGTKALAAKAEGGCEKSKQALIAKFKAGAKDAEHAEHAEHAEAPSYAQLAMKAEQGCDKSLAALIAHVKETGCPKMADTAAKAEEGCDKSKAALIAHFKEEAEAEKKVEKK